MSSAATHRLTQLTNSIHHKLTRLQRHLSSLPRGHKLQLNRPSATLLPLYLSLLASSKTLALSACLLSYSLSRPSPLELALLLPLLGMQLVVGFSSGGDEMFARVGVAVRGVVMLELVAGLVLQLPYLQGRVGSPFGSRLSLAVLTILQLWLDLARSS